MGTNIILVYDLIRFDYGLNANEILNYEVTFVFGKRFVSLYNS